MSRSVKDLRELICISRLSFGNDEYDNDIGEDLLPRENYDAAESLTSTEKGSSNRPHQESTDDKFAQSCSLEGQQAYSDLSSFDGKTYVDIPPRGNISHKDGRASREEINNGVVVGRPKSAIGRVRRPISAIKNTQNKMIMKITETQSVKVKMNGNSQVAENDEKSSSINQFYVNQDTKRNYIDRTEKILQFIDASVIANWLERSNGELDDIIKWLRAGNNFIQFANFMLEEFCNAKWNELIGMEISFILGELELAFKVGLTDRQLRGDDLDFLLSIILNEFPSKLLGEQGSSYMLKILIAFCCGKDKGYKKVLSNVEFTTHNKQYIQWLLAMRAFSLVSLTNGIVTFYKRLGNHKINERNPPTNSKQTGEDLKFSWLLKAVEVDFLEVFAWLSRSFIENGTFFTVDQKYSIVSKAISCGSSQIVQQLEKVCVNYFLAPAG